MAVRANTDSKFYFRFKLIGLAAFGFALWCLKDGAISYPKRLERAVALKQLEKDNKADDWLSYAGERGWPTDPPGEPEEVQSEIKMQYIMAAIAGTASLWCLLLVWQSRGRWIEATHSALKSSWGQSLDFDRIVSFDKKLWRSKGIGKLTYDDGNRRRRFVLDDCKYERQPTNEIVRLLEAKIGSEKIINGPPEPPPEELHADSSAPV